MLNQNDVRTTAQKIEDAIQEKIERLRTDRYLAEQLLAKKSGNYQTAASTQSAQVVEVGKDGQTTGIRSLHLQPDQSNISDVASIDASAHRIRSKSVNTIHVLRHLNKYIVLFYKRLSHKLLRSEWLTGEYAKPLLSLAAPQRGKKIAKRHHVALKLLVYVKLVRGALRQDPKILPEGNEGQSAMERSVSTAITPASVVGYTALNSSQRSIRHRIDRIANVLEVSPTIFFDDADTEQGRRPPSREMIAAFATSVEGCDLIENFMAIENAETRVRLLKTIIEIRSARTAKDVASVDGAPMRS